jgi:hypothetical protein
MLNPARESTVGQQAIVVFEENFETGDLTSRGWTGQLNDGERWSTSSRSVHSGSWSARYDCYNNASRGDMISPVIDLSRTRDNTLSFWVRSATRRWLGHNYFNHLYVYVSNDNGASWTEIDHLTRVETYTLKSYSIDQFITPTRLVRIKLTGQGGNADDNDKDTFVDDLRVTGTPFTPADPHPPTQIEILQYWAPQVYQDTRNDTDLGYRFYESADMIVRVNFDGDWFATNNWENTPRNGDYSAMTGYAYASFVETETHYYLGYQYYHSMDDAIIEADRHENDLEDVYICVRKGNAAGMTVTVHQHSGFGGYAVSLGEGSYTLTQLRALGMSNDDISSIMVPPGFRAVLYQHDNFQGAGWIFTTNDANFSDNGCNDDVSSIRIERTAPAGDEDYSPGTFECMITNRHGDMMKYTASDLRFSGSHAQIFISSNGDVWGGTDLFDFGEHGHGIENYRPGDHSLGNDAIVYNVADRGQVPADCSGVFSHAYNYALISINELWNRRKLFNGNPFGSYGNFAGEVQAAGGNAPWGKQCFTDPAAYFAAQFPFVASNGTFSRTYLHNPYLNTSAGSDGTPVLGLPSGWTGADIGAPSFRGSSHCVRGTFTIDGAGADIWGTSDQFHFVYRRLSGDCEIVARVYGVQQHIDAWSKAGVMIRESLAANARFAMMAATSGNGCAFQYRPSPGGECGHFGLAGITAPVWVKLVRLGNTITAYRSDNGITWTQAGDSITVAMGADVYAGLAVTSHNPSFLCSAVMDQVRASEL